MKLSFELISLVGLFSVYQLFYKVINNELPSIFVKIWCGSFVSKNHCTLYRSLPYSTSIVQKIRVSVFAADLTNMLILQSTYPPPTEILHFGVFFQNNQQYYPYLEITSYNMAIKSRLGVLLIIDCWVLNPTQDPPLPKNDLFPSLL